MGKEYQAILNEHDGTTRTVSLRSDVPQPRVIIDMGKCYVISVENNYWVVPYKDEHGHRSTTGLYQ